MKLTQKGLDEHGWLFSPSLGIMVAEHELGNGKWDIEVQLYRGEVNALVLDPSYVFPACRNIEQVISLYPEFAEAKDWIDGDKTEAI